MEVLDLNPNYVPVDKVQFQDGSKLLRLKSAVVHVNGDKVSNGHFITYVFLEDGDTLIMDDASGKIKRKKRLNEEDLNRLERGAYLLFYEAPISQS